MKILHISSAGRQSGAGKGVINLHRTLRSLDVDSRILFLVDEPSETESIFTISNSKTNKIKRFFITFLDNLLVKFYTKRKMQLFSPGVFGINLLNHPLVRESDLIHLHWVNHGFVDVNTLVDLKKPIVWTMRDMWVFTGGCHYSLDCNRFTSHCVRCPVLKSSSKDLSSFCQNRKENAYSRIDGIRWVAISNWLKTVAESSRLLNSQSIDMIHSGVEHQEFSPVERTIARKKFQLEENDKVILLGAQNIRDPYKGLDFAIDAINSLEYDVVVVVFGSPCETKFRDHVTLINVGYIKNSAELASLYSAADLFLCPSIAEAFGKTVVEAQMCGTPVVCFESTGPSEIVEHLKTGYKATFKSVSSLVTGLNLVINSFYDKVYISSRAKDKFSIDQNAREYIKIYEEMIMN
jgi:glycosyltransferase involved in cell wall biosynthesis